MTPITPHYEGITRIKELLLAAAYRIERALQPVLVDAPGWLQAAAEQALAKWRQGQSALRIANHQRDEAVALFRIAVAVSRQQQAGLGLEKFPPPVFLKGPLRLRHLSLG